MADEKSGEDPPPVPVVINGSAGRGDVAGARAVFEPLRAAGRVSIRVTDSAGVAPAVRTARDAGAREIVVVGGDGSIQRSAREVAGDGVVLVPAPGGTLNHFARRHGIATLEQAAALVERGVVTAVPLGVADDTLFLNTLVLGAYPSIVRLRERLEDVMSRWPAAAVGFVLELFRRRRVRVTLDMPGERVERVTGMVWIGLGRGSWPLSHRIEREPTDGELEVVVLRDLGRAASAAFLLRLLAGALGRGDASDDRAIERFRTRSLLVHAADGELEATLDGNIMSFPVPLFIASVERALPIRLAAP